MAIDDVGQLIRRKDIGDRGRRGEGSTSNKYQGSGCMYPLTYLLTRKLGEDRGYVFGVLRQTLVNVCLYGSWNTA